MHAALLITKELTKYETSGILKISDRKGAEAMRKYWRIVAAILTAVVLCVGCGGKRLSETASAMASLTAEDIAGFESFRWPNVTAEQLVAALNRAAAHEITAEEAAQAEAANTAEDEDFERYIGIPIKNGKYLMAACGAAADIVCVFDAGAALSSTYPAEKSTTAYFRDHGLYQLLWDSWEEQRDEPVPELIPPERLEPLPDKAELTTEVFTCQDLTVEVSGVYYTRKGTVQEDEKRIYENDCFVVCPGATVTVLAGGTQDDSEGTPHANWRFYTLEGDAVELLPGMAPLEITQGSSIGRESFPVLCFSLYEGWLQEPSGDPVEVVRRAIDAETMKGYVLSSRVTAAAIDDAETRRVAEMYAGSELARERGWTDTLLAEHFVAVRAEYDAEYDHTKTFLEDGHITQFFYLTQYDNGTWRITDSGMRQAG